MTEHTESYEHLDDVTMRIWNLPEAWDRDKQKQRDEISPSS